MFVGVDLALDRNVAVVLTEQAERLTRFRFPNNRDGYDYFYRRIEDMRERRQLSAVLVGMEPTNYFWKLLAGDIEQHRPDYGYRLVNPYTVKKHREGSQLDRSKDDNRDAFFIGDLLRTGKYTETRLLHGAYAELRQYVILRSRLQRDVRRQKIIIRNLSGQLFPELSQVFRNPTGETAAAMLREHAVAVEVRRMSQEAFIAGVRASFRGQRLQITKLRRVHALAERSVGLVDGVQALQLALRTHIETHWMLQQQLKEVNTALVNLFLSLPESKYLLSVPGLGVISGDIVKCCGSAPRQRASMECA
jgi:hypothetical protein